MCLHPEQVVRAGADHIERIGIRGGVASAEIVGYLGDGGHIVEEAIQIAVALRGGDRLGGAVAVVCSSAGRKRDRDGGQSESRSQ